MPQLRWTRLATLATIVVTGLVLIGAGVVLNVCLADSASDAGPLDADQFGSPMIVIGAALEIFALWASLARPRF